MLLKLHYAKFDVSRLFRSKVIEEKPLGGGRLDPHPPLVKEGLTKKHNSVGKHMSHFVCRVCLLTKGFLSLYSRISPVLTHKGRRYIT